MEKGEKTNCKLRATRRPKPSYTQKEMVAKFMEAHPDLARGRGRQDGADAVRHAANLWRAVTNKLNASGKAAGGCVKSYKDWRKYWNDKKGQLKLLARRLLLEPTEVGPLSMWDKRMLKVLGDYFEESTANNVTLLTTGAEVAKKMITFSPTEPPPLHDIKGRKDPLLQEDEEKCEWYDEEVIENEEEEEENMEIKLTGLKNEPCDDLRDAKSKKSRAMVQPADTRINRELINQSNQSFGMFIANELQQYEPVERYEIMKKIIDIFIKR